MNLNANRDGAKPCLHPIVDRRTRYFSPGPVRDIAIAQDSGRAVSVSAGGTVIIWDLKTGQRLDLLSCLLHKLPRRFGGDLFRLVSVTADGSRAVFASGLYLMVCGLATKEFRVLSGHSGEIRGVLLTPDGTQAISGSDDGTIKIWDLAAGKVRHSFGPEYQADVGAFSGFPVQYEVVALSLSEDGCLAVAGLFWPPLSWGMIWLLDVETGKLLHEYAASVNCDGVMSSCPNGTRALIAGGDEGLEIWNLIANRMLHSIRTSEASAVLVMPDAQRAVSAHYDGMLNVWDTETGSKLMALKGHAKRVGALSPFPDGQHVVSVSDDGTLKVWDLKGGAAVATYQGGAAWQCLSIAPDGQTIVAGDSDGLLHFLQVEGI